MIDRIGLVFGRLTIKSVAVESQPKKIKYVCRCECGTEKTISWKSISRGDTKSCGCLAAEKKIRGSKYQGLKFGRLTVVKVENIVLETGKYRQIATVLCECGSTTVTKIQDMATGGKTKCSICVAKDRAADAVIGVKNHLYGTWRGMVSRCYNQKSPIYKYYGGRGIAMCDRWRGSRPNNEIATVDGFIAFCTDMGEKPTNKHSVDRIDVDGIYEPSNCRWATTAEQAANKRKNPAPH